MHEGNRLHEHAAELGRLAVARGIGGGVTHGEIHSAIIRGFGLVSGVAVDPKAYEILIENLFQSVNMWLVEAGHSTVRLQKVLPNNCITAIRGVLMPNKERTS